MANTKTVSLQGNFQIFAAQMYIILLYRIQKFILRKKPKTYVSHWQIQNFFNTSSRKEKQEKKYNTLSTSIIDCIYAPLDTLREHSVQLRKFLQVLNRKTIRSPLMPLSLNHADMQ